MKKFVDSLIYAKKVKSSFNSIEKSGEVINWNIRYHGYLISELQSSLSEKEIFEYPFTRTDIHRLIDNNIIYARKISTKTLVKLILEGKLDFYKVSSPTLLRQFSKNELLKIINCEHFYRTSKAGMQAEPVAVLNARTLVIRQQNLNIKMISKFIEKGIDISKTLNNNKKRLVEMARKERNKEFELFLECM